MRTFCANLRIHAVRTTILVALARAFALEESAEGSEGVIVRNERHGIQADAVGTKARADPRRLKLVKRLVSAESAVKQAYARHPNMGHICHALLQHGIVQLSSRVQLAVGTCIFSYMLTPGTPITPMLGSITRSLDTIFQKMQDHAFVSEFKYDGQRVQLHVENDRVHIFSRHLEDITDKYPDIVAMVPKLLGDDVKSFIMDAEVVAVSSNGELQPFQSLSNRARKQVSLDDIMVQVCVFVFDLMYWNGRSLLQAPLRERRALYRSLPAPLPSSQRVAGFDFVETCESSEPEVVSDFFKRARSSLCEGIMVKRLDHDVGAPIADGENADAANGDAVAAEDAVNGLDDALDDDALATASEPSGPARGVFLATYEPDRRTEAWLKVKKDYIEGLGDSLDLVPIGAWHGMGRKASWWSPILLAVYDAETGMYQVRRAFRIGSPAGAVQVHERLHRRFLRRAQRALRVGANL